VSLPEKKLNILLGEKIEDVCGKETIKAAGGSVYAYFARRQPDFHPRPETE
jgi:hypothetical protein